MQKSFKDLYDYEKRIDESSRIRKKYPERIPVIVEKDKSCKNLDDIDKHKYLFPADLTIGQLLYVIRKRIKGMDPSKALFVFVGKSMPCMTDTIAVLYDGHKDEDGFLYFTYSGENTFG